VPSLLILRHGEAGHSFSGDDHSRTLTSRGQEQSRQIGSWLSDSGLLPDATMCSDAMRARQTCIWVNEQLGEKAPTAYLDDRLYLAAPREMLSVINETPETVQALLVVAHMPGVQEVSMELASVRSEEEPVIRMAGSWPTAGIAHLQFDKPWAELDGRDARLVAFHVPGAQMPGA